MIMRYLMMTFAVMRKGGKNEVFYHASDFGSIGFLMPKNGVHSRYHSFMYVANTGGIHGKSRLKGEKNEHAHRRTNPCIR